MHERTPHRQLQPEERLRRSQLQPNALFQASLAEVDRGLKLLVMTGQTVTVRSRPPTAASLGPDILESTADVAKWPTVRIRLGRP
jgi:hypothetical protein